MLIIETGYQFLIMWASSIQGKAWWFIY